MHRAGDTLQGSPPKRHRRDAIGAVISIVSLAAVIWWAIHQQPPSLPSSASGLALLAAAVIIYLFVTLIRGWRWHEILVRAGIRHRTRDAYELVFVGYMGNSVLPLRGGEVLRILLMAPRSDARRREILGTIVAERLLDALVLSMMFLALLAAGRSDPGVGKIVAPVAIVVGVIVAALAITTFLLRQRAWVGRTIRALEPVARASRLLLSARGLAVLVATILIWSIDAIVFMLIARSLDLQLDAIDATFLVVLTAVLTMIPAAPGYVGTLDGALALGLDSVGIKGGAAVGFVLLVRFVLFLPVTAIGLAIALARYGGLRALIRSLRRSGDELGRIVSPARVD